MSVSIRIFLQQTVRKKSRFVLNLALLCAVTVFFVVSLNLYANSMRNLQTVEDTYSTIATMEIYGDVNKEGDLVQPSAADRVGRFLLTRYGYDLSPLQELPMVQNIDLRYRCAAYIPEQVPLTQYAQERYPDPGEISAVGLKENDTFLGYPYNTFRFQIKGDQPVEVDLTKESSRPGYAVAVLNVTVTASVYPQIQYEEKIGFSIQLMNDERAAQYGDDIRRLNRTEDTHKLIFYPGVEYVVEGAFNLNSWYRYDTESKQFITVNHGLWHTPEFAGANMTFSLSGLNCAYTSIDLQYRNSGEYYQYQYASDAPYQIQRWEDVQSDPEEAAYWDTLWNANLYSVSSFAVTLTDDITDIPAWYVGLMYLNEGRAITEEEYASGAKVCMISARLAEKQGWQVGDKLDLYLYQHERFSNGTGTFIAGGISASVYTEDFFGQGEYEIVGIYGDREVATESDAAPEVFAQPWNVIYIPENSAPHAPAVEDRPIQPSLITIELKNGSINAFKAAVEEMGLTDQVPGEYEIKFSCFDQGYSKIAGGLQEMNRNAKILLGLSAALLAVTMILTAFLFSRQHKHSAGILRMLGGSKKQAFTAILVCAAAVVAAGGIVGTVLGGALTQTVGASIMGDVESSTVALATGANATLTALTGAGCIVLFLLLTAIFTATYIGKEPRGLLPKDQA